MQELLEQDMKDCLAHAFEKLALRQQSINRDVVKLAIMHMLKLYIPKEIKKILQKMNRWLRECTSENVIDRSKFRLFVHQSIKACEETEENIGMGLRK